MAASGVIIEGKRILCNAHAVLYASQVQVQANQSGDKISANVEAVAFGMDLAVLKLDDESYFIYGPLAFSSASVELVADVPNAEVGISVLKMLIGTGSPLVRRLGDKPASDDERLVFVAGPFFSSKLAKGYDNPAARVIKTINGVAIKNLGHLVEVLRNCRDEFITIEFEFRGGDTMVFRRDEMLAATDDILTENGIRNRGSPDMLAIWNAKSHGDAANPRNNGMGSAIGIIKEPNHE